MKHLINIIDLISIAKDVQLKTGVLHRCIDPTQIHELPTTTIVNCPECMYKETCISTMNRVDPDGFCKWGVRKEGDCE